MKKGSIERHLIPEEDLSEYASVYRELISEENSRWNERTKWLLQLQSFLFAGLALGWEKNRMLMWVFAFVGIGSAVSIGNMAIRASHAIKLLVLEWNEKKGDADVPRITGSPDPKNMKGILFKPERVLPCLFVTAWLGIITIHTFESYDNKKNLGTVEELESFQKSEQVVPPKSDRAGG